MRYKYNNAVYNVNVTAFEDGDVVIAVGNYPVQTRFYLHADGAQKLAEQIMEALSAAQQTKQGAEA